MKRFLFSVLLVTPLSSIADNSKVDVNLRAKTFTKPDEFKIDVWADNSLTKNPSYFYFDSKGRMFMTELYRIGKGVEDVRRFSKEATIADIEIETLDDRLDLYKNFSAEFPDNQKPGVPDKIVLIEDANNDGIADSSKVFADGFNKPLEGLGVGVIERDGKVYYTNIPSLWVLEDEDKDGVSDKREELLTGFGTRVSFLGHDLHGLVWGPAGKLYWSLGDRGYDITTKEGDTLHQPNHGAVFRSDPDGSNLEVFYHGLRNPQELVFDEFGNLFTADNDGDRSDTERVNHLIEGGDSGWHAGHQTIMSFTDKLELRSAKYTGDKDIPVAWLTNDMSIPRNDNQPAYMLPGILKLLRGPSGFTYNPTNYLGEKWRNTFFIAHYGGSQSGSYISTFKTKEHGASFLPIEKTTFLKGVNVSDIDFGPDGRFYISEFNFGGWSNVNEGAIYALDLLEAPANLVKQHNEFHDVLLADYSTKSVSELADLLATDHQRIRQQAQFELAKRGQQAFVQFDALAHDPSKDVFSRIHSIWGLSQLVLNHSIQKEKLASLIPLLNDKNEQVRIQSARVLGDHKAKFAESALIKALADNDGQVAMYAAIGLGRMGSSGAVSTVINKLVEVSDKDLWLRHGLVMALKGVDKKYWIQHKSAKSKDVRMAVLLALRELKDDQVADFLHDDSIAIVDEAILAIGDKALTSVRSKVAELLDSKRIANTDVQEFVHHRIINANFNEGRAEDAKRLLAYAAVKGLKERLASEALAAIEGWNDLNPIDTITGLPSLANKSRADISQLVLQYLPKILENTEGKALVQAMSIAQQFNYQLSEDVLAKIAQDPNAKSNIRIQALDLLAERFPAQGIATAKKLLDSKALEVKAGALVLVLDKDHAAGTEKVEQLLTSGSVALQKIALSTISTKTTAKIDAWLASKLEALMVGTGENAITLELLSAVEKNSSSKVTALYSEYQQKMQSSDLLTQFSGALAGGDKQVGRDIFYTNGAAQCIRCHIINKKGSNVGPDLSAIGSQRSAEYLLQALVDPSGAIAPGYGTFNLTMHNGSKVSGVFTAETDNTIELEQEGKLHRYNKSDIKDIQRPASGMPPMNYMLSKAEIRDVVAFLSSLKGKGKKAKISH
ncbi:HEAT repeat domain-containing protein [Paraglaciecola aquimarina]|uniref:HEAT repeat domain-containing protein n=1 Tax=Paraglaciecola aquimarina TaxID=1235557 RepID=A0ABU3SSG9_9ALTE|nr:PVC-type heme-binding CxxCH protein [Paraglaciecola aquimarina]MDU0352963.1 HEAT repeat domain-containing protein [Paraglaciecola aquimarina]